MGYYPLNISVTNEKLEAVMRAEMYKHKIQCPQLERTLHMCGSFAEVHLLLTRNFIFHCLNFYPHIDSVQ